MKKIRKAIIAILKIIKNPWLLNNVLSNDTVWNDYLITKHRVKNGLPMVELDQLTSSFSETIDTFSFLDGGSLPTDIALLKIICRRFTPCMYFEIGTWRGESVVNVSDICNECYTLNLSQSDLLNQGVSKSYANLHGFFSKDKKNIYHLYGNSMNFDFNSLGKKFDVIFIDGNHHFEYVKNYTEKVFKHLMHEKSIVVWHDYAYNPEKIRPEVFAGILDGLETGNRKYLYHVANTMCAVFIREEFITKILESPMTPNKKFKIKLDLESL